MDIRGFHQRSGSAGVLSFQGLRANILWSQAVLQYREALRVCSSQIHPHTSPAYPQWRAIWQGRTGAFALAQQAQLRSQNARLARQYIDTGSLQVR